MSLLRTTDDGWIISHLQYINEIYNDVSCNSENFKLQFDEKIFNINSQFMRDAQLAKSTDGVVKESSKRKRRKRSEVDVSITREVEFIRSKFMKILTEQVKSVLFSNSGIADNNEEARLASTRFFQESCNDTEFHGANATGRAAIRLIGNVEYVFPGNSTFYSYDIKDISAKLPSESQFDFVLIDPPWWNKFVRRRQETGYKMMYNSELNKIPIAKLLKSNGLVAVWCTNAPSHRSDIFEMIFPSWGVKPVATWYWIKVTRAGHPICNFNSEGGKQPYELLIFGVNISNNETVIPDGKILISVPSSAHSHKPPLARVAEPYLPENPKCLELFARYLLPNWTSYGLEVLKFQQLSLYTSQSAS